MKMRIMLTKMGMSTNLPLGQMPSPTQNLRSVDLEDVEDDDEDETKTPEKDHKCNFQFFTSLQPPNHFQAEPGYDHGSNSVAEPESEPSTKGEPEVKT